MTPPGVERLDPVHLSYLAAVDGRLGRVASHFPHLSYRLRPAGFEALLRLIIEQQLSVKAADTILGRVRVGLGDMTPKALLDHDPERLRGYGLSRPKIAYARALAEAVHTGAFDPTALLSLETEDAAVKLMAQKGIGRWTAEVYLMFCEGRRDLFPVGDIALREAVGWLDQLESRPDERYCTERALLWSPYRSLAAHLLWGWYGAVKRGELSRESLNGP